MQFKTWLDRKKITQAEACRRLGMDRSKMCRILAGAENPTLFQAALIDDFTNGEVPPCEWVSAEIKAFKKANK